MTSSDTEAGLRIAIAQVNLLVGDIEGNARMVVEYSTRLAESAAADIVIFPELTLTGYPPEDLLLRPETLERVERALDHIAGHSATVAIVVGFPSRGERGLHNSAALIQHGKMAAIYHKQRLPNYSVFDERRYFIPGSEACVVRVKNIAIGLTICEDMWHPGAAGQARHAGAELLLNLNASPFHLDKGREREAILAARCRETGLPLVYANLVGGQDELLFDGDSMVLNGDGKVVMRCPAFSEAGETIEFERIDGMVVTSGGTIAQPLASEAAIYNALVLGVRDYINKNRFSGAVIGLSGGIDSALTLAIATDAIGAERITAVMMPFHYTAAISIEDAEMQARSLGVAYRVVPIEPAVAAFHGMLGDMGIESGKGTTGENIQARCRGLLLMAISNQTGSIVLTTGNKSEMAVGYATLYGDMAGGFAPLKDVDKTMVYRLANYRNSLGEPAIPQRVIDRAPSAELAPDQLDQDSLPPYDILDPILQLHIEQDRCIDEIIAAGFAPETVRRVVAMVDRNEYKRRQAAPGIRVSRRAFGRDRRYPITSGFGLTSRRHP